MASELASETLFDDVSTCHTTKHLHSTIHKHQHPPSNSKHPHRYFDPAEYHITEIAVLKQRFFIQHEGLIIRVHHQPSESASASDSTQPAAAHSEPDFLISIDRNIDSTGLKSFFFSKKFAIDRVNCHLSPAASPAITGTFGRPVVWRIPSPHSNCTFNLNLSQFVVLLDAVLFSYPQQEYNNNALFKNCFSHSRILRGLLIRMIQEQQPLAAGGNVVQVAAQEPSFFGVTLGKCFGFRLDRDEGEEEVVFENYKKLYEQFLS